MKLASIQEIQEIKPIDGADKIELARVLGYQTIVRKGEFKTGDLCIWHEPDTIVPETERYEFLRNKNFRLKVMKMRGQVSQGLALPIDGITGKVGDDLTDLVGIKKYEKPLPSCLSGTAAGYFPAFIPKTDEPNLRSYPDALTEFRNQSVIITQKIDGSSGTFFKLDGKLRVCSRNIELKEDDTNVFWKVAKEYEFESKLRDGLVLQGEVYGPGIQGNPVGAGRICFSAFNLFDIESQRYFNHEPFFLWCHASCIPTVNAIAEYQLFDLTLDELVCLANTQLYGGLVIAEGIVLRPTIERLSYILPQKRLSAKVINENYALKHGE